MGRFIIRLFVKLLIPVFFRLKVTGLSNLPATGGYIVASNHLGRFDAFLVYYLLNREDIILFVAEKYKESAMWRWVVKSLNAIWLNRFNADFAAMREALRRLKAGGAMVIAPEGTRSPTGALIQARPGVSYLAVKAGMPVVPVACTGLEDKIVFPMLKKLRRPRITVTVGQPFLLPQARGAVREEQLAEYTDEIMTRIAALLPESYRGVYAQHPRLKELLASAPEQG